jgi:hypothetical protein
MMKALRRNPGCRACGVKWSILNHGNQGCEEIYPPKVLLQMNADYFVLKNPR